MIEISYRNPKDRMIVIRCLGPNNFFYEKVLFPHELVGFLAPENAILEIWGIEHNDNYPICIDKSVVLNDDNFSKEAA